MNWFLVIALSICVAVNLLLLYQNPDRWWNALAAGVCLSSLITSLARALND